MISITLEGAWTVKNERTGTTYPAVVPGFVQKDLTEQGVLPDLYDTLLEEKIEWIEHDDWTYSRSFRLTPESLGAKRIELVFEGIDTYAEIELNGQTIARADNMWLPVRCDITELAQEDNKLLVMIASPTRTLQDMERQFGDPLKLWNGIPARLFGRKAQYGYGWDWGPRLVTVGIHQSVRVEAHGGIRAEKPVYQLPFVSDAQALVNASVRIANTTGSARPSTIEWRLLDGEAVVAEASVSAELAPGENRCAAPLAIANPKRWYPIGYGEQPLYRLEVEVRAKGCVSESACTVGVREVRIAQPYDEQGRKFVFEINGVPILCKGVNWIPLTLYPNLDSPQTYLDEIEAIAAANMNMIRIWGGGTYENQAFYDACDRLGILVWQDFMFACGDYPDDDAFCALVRREADHVVAAYGDHPSIVLWCGNNENQHFIVNSKKHRREGYGEKLFFEVLADAAAVDTLRPYWPTSPYDLSVDSSANNETCGDMHYWHVWGRTHPYEDYASVNGRFLSEFGMQSYPSMQVLDAVDPEADLRDPKFVSMQKAPNGLQRLLYYTAGDYRLPASKREFVYVNQLMQANALRLAVEHWISRMPDTSGALIWQWSDLWPSISWSIVDYNKVYKPSYYAMKRSFQTPNALAKILPGDGQAELFLIHERGDFQGKIVVELYDIETETTVHTEEIEAVGTGFRSTRIGQIAVGGYDPSRVVLFVLLYEGERLLARNSYLLGKPHALRLKPPSLEIQRKETADGEEWTVISRVFAKDVWIADVTGALSDNGFDLKAGESRTIALPRGASQGDVQPTLLSLNGVTSIGYV
ncbi:beta-mannosidase [Paenibacillus methanolicus]|uniref:beta-mannosidase n=1 Tax=Paenibacillus methanolicus TaxID=582686 RepID=A0A5S5CJ59_9BACL|nr:glycoside hydrolase family 2 protein [Paenibacillus methanolicus]TYP79732.1 beta-mannosidase [Paenibacillus methanolicus]